MHKMTREDCGRKHPQTYCRCLECACERARRLAVVAERARVRREEVEPLVEVLYDVQEELDKRSDVIADNEHTRPNWAMALGKRVSDLLAAAEARKD